MKKYFALIALALMVSSCSVNILDKNKKEYVESIIVCDSKTKNFEIINHSDIAEFFDGEGGSVKIKYKYKEYKNSKHDTAKTVEVLRGRTRKEEKRFYMAEFKRVTFPFSYCRKLKTDHKYFK